MTFFETMNDTLQRVGAFGEVRVDAGALPESAMGLSDSGLRELLAETSSLQTQLHTLQAVLAGVASSRSTRDRGHSGFSQETGHRNAVELMRDLTGVSRGEAIRAVKVGESLLDGVGADPGAEPGGDAGVDAAPPVVPWHLPVKDALLAGRITTAQSHVIRGGLGIPPQIDGRDDDDVIDAWRAAAAQLVDEAPSCTVEDLASRARCIRDLLDPAGAEDRHRELFERRSYRWSTTTEGLSQAHITFDPEMGAWVRSVFDAALSPRRGGPRFVADDEKRAAEELVRDPRSNDQLAYDLFADIFRTGAKASADDVFGYREAGVRLVALRDSVTGEDARRDAFGRLVAVAHSDDGSLSVPGSVLDRALCDTGTVGVTVDTCGNPLDVGREQRLFTKKQRIALALRDGGCVWPACDRPPQACEAHHCTEWSRGGKTDCNEGVLLCRYHHLNLHNNGWRIRREGGRFLLYPPPNVVAEAMTLAPKGPMRWLWDPPPGQAGWRLAA